jgi:hypothetical protein
MAGAYGLVVTLLALAPVVAGSQARPSGSPLLHFPTHATVDGRLAHYLRSLDGDVDGLVLDDGAVARFAPGHPLAFLPYRRGDQVRIHGDVVAGLPGPILVHATVEPWPGLFAGIALRPPQQWSRGLQPSAVPEALFTSGRSDTSRSRKSVATRTAEPDDRLSAQHPRLQQGSRVTKAEHWLKRATSGTNPEGDPRFTRHEEDEGP